MNSSISRNNETLLIRTRPMCRCPCQWKRYQAFAGDESFSSHSSQGVSHPINEPTNKELFLEHLFVYMREHRPLLDDNGLSTGTFQTIKMLLIFRKNKNPIENDDDFGSLSKTLTLYHDTMTYIFLKTVIYSRRSLRWRYCFYSISSLLNS